MEKRPLETSVEQILRADTRAGARAILASIDKRRFENRAGGQRLRKMLRFETSLWESGQRAVAGVEEAGMSPLAGPVSAGAVILKPGTRIVGIDDSKKLDASAREELAKEIKAKAVSWCVAFVEVEAIDAINIYWAGIQAMQRAVRAHYEALARLGACAAHRRSFGPGRKALGLRALPPWPSASERPAG
ncbi:hypothetical protein [Bradyrhizobium japonicum]|uniref:hypothetical protein n=1 Tax=Bradyrhizobium japonicum TaxID=375 RepID=UPI00271502D7|nr:hypothetical protein [Bradyrhizobium japonicum]WLB24448.1 hypothetical protein QIH95_49635 [Bradyrhizobium japonicum]